MRFPWGFDEEDDRCRKLKIEMVQQIMVLRQSGVSQFLVACDCGVGLYAGEIINGLREAVDPELMLFCYTPHEEQATKWAPYLRERYFTMLEKCTYISAVCPVGALGAQIRAYRKIIDLADVVLCVYDTEVPTTIKINEERARFPFTQGSALLDCRGDRAIIACPKRCTLPDV